MKAPGLHRATTICSDSQGEMELARNESTNRRNKYTGIAYHVFTDAVVRKEVDLMYMATIKKVVDVLTKPLGRIQM